MTEDLYIEVLKSEPSKTMLTEAQLSDLVDNYATQLVDSMDMKTMEQFVFDTIVNNVSGLEQDELIAELRLYYDDEDVSEMIKSVGADPDVIL
jgi:hypothetical protein